MNLQAIDLVIMVAFTLGLAFIAIYAKQFNRSVADFLVANRCTGRYMLSISGSMAGTSAVSIVAMFELYYKGGFSAFWWGMLCAPIAVFMGVSGWVYYRFRETRVLTVAQFYEIRYSRRLRVFCGIVSWLAGVINIGIFPAVTAKFFMFFCGLPNTFNLFGTEVSTFATVMIVELSIALCFTFLGGMVVIVLTNLFQGIFNAIGLLVILVALLFIFDWDQIASAVIAAPENASLINPYRNSEVEGFNMSFFIISAWFTFYGTGVTQHGTGLALSAKNAHESKMAGIIGHWRGILMTLMVMIVAMCAYTFLNGSYFAEQSQVVHDKIASITDPQIQKQATVTLVLTQLLPPGMLGLFAVMMIAFANTSYDTVLHGWGSVLIQDVILPFRKKGFTPKQHMWLLRGSILLVAVFIFFFSLVFSQTEYIMMYMTLSIGIIISGFGSIVIGGLYWKRGSLLGAWLSAIVGCSLCFMGLLAQQLWPHIAPTLTEMFPGWKLLAEHQDKFPYNGMEIAFWASVCAMGSYVIGSLCSWLVLRKPAFNIEQMLHRGEYAIKGEHQKDVTLPDTGLKTLIPGKEYTRGDKLVYFLVMGTVLGWVVALVATAIYQYVWGISDKFWLGFWHLVLVFTIVASVATTIWITIGGIFDFKYMIHTLRTAVRNIVDDGRVSHDNTSGQEFSKTINEKQKDEVSIPGKD